MRVRHSAALSHYSIFTFTIGELEWKLLANLAILDDHALMAIVDLAEERDAPALCAMAEQFVDTGECRLASRVGELVVQNLAAGQSSNDAHFLCARAHFELDEYDQALIDMTAMSFPIPCRAHLLRGEIEASRGNWTDAKTAYERTCASTEGATPLINPEGRPFDYLDHKRLINKNQGRSLGQCR